MTTDKPRPDLLGSEVHTSSVWILAAVLIAVWVVSHLISRRFLKTKPLKLAGFAVRTLLGAVAIWAIWQAVARHLVLETDWPLWMCGLIGGFSIEVLIAFYQLEKRIVRPGLGRWLLALRLVVAAAVLIILAQPVFTWDETERIDRNVVVLLDDSASMQIADKDMPVAEKLAVAAFEGIDVIKDRPALPRLFSEAKQLASDLERVAELFKVPDNYSRDEVKEFIATNNEEINRVEKAGLDWAEGVGQAMDENRREQRDLPEDIRRLRNEVRKRAINDFRERMKQFRNGLARNDEREIRNAAREAAIQLQRGMEIAGPYADAVDEKFYASLPGDAREKIDAAAARPRAEIAQQILTRKQGDAPSLLDQIAMKYTLRHMRFGKKAAETDRVDGPEGDASFRSRTDLSGALKRIKETYEGDRLAGVVVVSDFRHNGATNPDNEAHAIGVQGAPIVPILTGSSRGTKDAAIISVGSPQSVFLGDRVRVKAEIKADGLRGQQVAVKLLREGAVIHEEKVPVPDNDFRTTLRFSHQPPEKGIFNYTVRVDPVEGELFPNNNEWSFDVAVSDDRTNVLLIDDRPRWEFRYLRNLFDSRDKSVHLQYVLLHPDTLQGAPALPAIPASASRKFGDSEATRLPASPEEWRKFDVIILGDLPPAVLGEDTWKIIRECVDERGAMLVIVAGPAHMPHAFTNETARSLIPVEYEYSTAEMMLGPEPAYRLMLTAEGRNHPIFEATNSQVDNARIWSEVPVMRWRHAIKGIRKGAEVLAWARPVPVDAFGNPVEGSDTAPADSGDLATALTRQRETERQQALMVASQAGLGKVAMLNFDQTWRFRYGVGDTIHHKFWGQLMRWGAGENLASGTEHVRLGTRKLNYETGEKVRVMARLVDESFRPLADAEVGIAVYNEDGQVVLRKNLAFQAQSHGMYETEFESLTEPGAYRIELTGAKVDELLAQENVRTVDQKLTILSEGNPVELGEVSVNPELAARVASLSGGVVARPDEAAQVLSLFGEATKEVEETKETKLWDNWMILALAVAAATAEWILRRKGGLV
jgi:hypothetical protein